VLVFARYGNGLRSLTARYHSGQVRTICTTSGNDCSLDNHTAQHVVYENQNGVAVGIALMVHARRPVVTKKPFALGIDDHLDGFAKKNGATTWKQFDDAENWQPQDLDKILDPKQKVLFNLDRVDVWSGVSRSASVRGGATDWELLQIRQNPQTWDTIDFIKDGSKVENPFQ